MRKVVFLSLCLVFAAAVMLCGRAADFSLKDMAGDTFTLSDHLGKRVIVIDFWATWCKPCKKLLKRLNRIHLDYRGRVDVIAISVDDASARAMAEGYIKGKGFSFRVLFDPDSRVSRIFNPGQQMPFTVIIDRQGEVVYTHVGYIPGIEQEIRKKIEELVVE